MKDFKFYDRIAGWASFAVAMICYLLTVEPTASWWDCGEFIATAVKLEVGHPPGAPLWMIIGRVAALFAPDDAHMALMMNCTAVLAAAFTSLFLFWSITHLARRIVERKSYRDRRVDYYSVSETIAILGSGMVGALIYTFCDTAWFSAVEAEVYSMSSLFTAVVFWLILKWEEHADEKYSNRWLILICYLMGLSIGVHLLNLLVIPAIVLVYYYKKFQNPSHKGVMLALAVSVVILAFVLYFIIPQTVNVGAYFDLFFVNVLGMPYYSGIITFLLLVMGGLGYWAWITQKNGKALQNTIALSVFMIMLGYTSFAMTVIRSFSNPPINENQPSDGFSLLSYLNREQYGDTPLFYGPYFTADVVGQEREYTYIPENGKYLKIQKPAPKYFYDSENQGFFPRMHSSNENHIKAYMQWGGLDNVTQRPSFAQNLRFFFSYQLGHMYFRYFMWNFCGRQSDVQNGAGSTINGNWITGIDFIDGIRDMDSANLPDRYANNHGRNVYYLLPLLLGFLGIFVSWTYDSKNCFVVFLFFLLTGVAIVVYLNQTPYQPRERDYAYAGSFYAFSIWCGLGLLAIWDWLQQKSNPVVASSVACLSLLVPVQMASQNWDDHDRSGRYTCRDFATDYLESCAPNAILFTFGDNDTFPLWYCQEVEGIRRDVRVVNLSLAGCDWYIRQAQQQMYEGAPVPMSLSAAKYRQDKRNILIIQDQKGRFVTEQYNSHKQEFESAYTPIYNDLLLLIDGTSFPQKYASDYQQIIGGADKVSPSLLARLVFQLDANKQLAESIFGANIDKFNALKDNLQNLIVKISGQSVPISSVIAVAGDDEDMVQMQNGEKYNYLPAKNVSIPVNKANCLENGTISADTESRVKDVINWTISKNYFTKSDLVILDILSKNDWKRPVYFAASGSPNDYLGLDKFMRLEGFAYRIVPYEVKAEPGEIGEIDSKIMYNNMMNKFVWGRVNADDVVIEENNRRQMSIMDIRGTFARLASKLAEEGNTDKAKEVLEKCMEIVPRSKMAYDYSMLPVVSAMVDCGMDNKAVEVISQMGDEYDSILAWLDGLRRNGSFERHEMSMSVSIVGFLAQEAESLENEDLSKKLIDIYSRYAGLLGQAN
ncbi:MAG: DUF2723 domain-containing protein [Bacteroidales bacterium]|nr:DUF2723 domain-containing protein [Bacteroidales bacterium]